MSDSTVRDAEPFMTQRTAFVFDIDDTLYLERDYVRSGFRAVGEWARDRFGCDDFAARCWSRFEEVGRISNPSEAPTPSVKCAEGCNTADGFPIRPTYAPAEARRTIFNAVLAELALPHDPQTIEAAVTCYRTHQPDIRLLPDAEALLWRLERDWAAAIAFISDGPLLAQQRKADALGLSRFSDTILLTDQWGRDFWKPHPRAFETAERLLSVLPAKCIYIADNPTKDFHTPRQRGWRTIRIRRPEGLHATLEAAPEALPDIEVASLHELTKRRPLVDQRQFAAHIDRS